MTDFHRSRRLHAVRGLTALTVCLSLAVSGCGGNSATTTDAPSTAPAPEAAPAPGSAPAPGPAPAPAAPTIAAVSPATGFMSGGGTVTLTGTGLAGATAVLFGRTAATGITVVSDTQVTVTVPAHSAGTVDVEVTTPLGTGTAASGYSYSTAGQILTIAGGGGLMFGNGIPATTVQLLGPSAVVEDRDGNLLVGELGGHRVRVVAKTTGRYWGINMTAGSIYTIAGTGDMGSTGDGGPATAAKFNGIGGLAIDQDGNLAISEYNGNRIRLLAASDGSYYGIAMTAGHVHTIAGGSGGSLPPDDVAGPDAILNQPLGLASDADGNILVTGSRGVYVIAARSGTYYGHTMNVGWIYTLAGLAGPGFSGDGAPARSATLDRPAAVLADANGHVLVADSGNHRVRAIAARSGTDYGVAMAAGNIYTIAGNGTASTSGDGGSPLVAALQSPSGLAIDAAGNLVIGSMQSGRLRAIAATTQTRYAVAMTAGTIQTIAGGGATPSDGGPATSASINWVYGLGVDSTGQLLVPEFDPQDLSRHRVRTIAP